MHRRIKGTAVEKYNCQFISTTEKENTAMKKMLLTVGTVLTILCVAAAVWGAWMWHETSATADKMYKSENSSKEAHQTVATRKPISLLLLGVDERKDDKGRSDTIIVLTLNPKTKTMQMISIPRDTRTTIVGKNVAGKINAAYAYGGVSTAEKTVSRFLNDVPFDFYIKINMQGMKDLVDATGGVEVDNQIAWVDEGYYKKGYPFKKGKIYLKNGAMALGYVRMRHLDPQGDIGRNKRQRQVIMAIIDKMSGVGSVSRYTQILHAIGKNVTTDMTFDDMKNVALHYRDARKHTKSYEVHEKEQVINGADYLVATDAERQRVHEMIMQQLEK
jgi:LCP family protein required for cell wall assembly